MRYLLLLMVALGLGSCSAKLTPFSQSLYEEYNWSDAELKRIQFYLSENVTLWRDAGSEESSISNGKIRIKDGRKIEEIKFNKGTPGVMIFSPKDNRFAISFDEGDDQFLMFGPNPNANNRYVLLGKKWDKRQGQITYDGKTYFTSTKNAFATLMVDIREANQLKINSKTVHGRKVK